MLVVVLPWMEKKWILGVFFWRVTMKYLSGQISRSKDEYSTSLLVNPDRWESQKQEITVKSSAKRLAG